MRNCFDSNGAGAHAVTCVHVKWGSDGIQANANAFAHKHIEHIYVAQEVTKYLVFVSSGLYSLWLCFFPPKWEKGNYNYANQCGIGIGDLSYSIHVPDVDRRECVVVVSRALDARWRNVVKSNICWLSLEMSVISRCKPAINLSHIFPLIWTSFRRFVRSFSLSVRSFSFSIQFG